MKHRKRVVFTIGEVGFAVLFCLLHAPVIAAEDALEAHKRGVALYQKEQYKEAGEAFRLAYEIRPTWKLLFNIAQCEASIKHYGLALEAFETYLVEGGDEVSEERRDYVTAEIRRMQPLVGVVDIKAPDGVQVLVDGEPRGTTPLQGPVRVAAGLHEIEIRRGDERLYKEELRIAGGISTDVSLDGEMPRVEKAPEPKKAEPGGSPKSPALKIVGWIAVGTGAAMLLGGAITGGMAIAKSEELHDRCPNKQCPNEDDRDLKESADNLALATNILLPAGGVIAALGAVLLIVDWKKNSPNEALEARIEPVVDENKMGFVVEGKF